jgi:hypothetical protein
MLLVENRPLHKKGGGVMVGKYHIVMRAYKISSLLPIQHLSDADCQIEFIIGFEEYLG